MKKEFWAIFAAALLWFMMFSPWTATAISFWLAMSFAAIILLGMSFRNRQELLKSFNFSALQVGMGLASAVVLYGIFYLGNYLSTAWFDFAKPQINDIYGLKTGNSPYLIGTLLLLLIGPAEEIFWRGYVQRTMGERWGDWTAFFVTTAIYALVHIWSFNFMLIMAALVCGAFWGLLFIYNKKNITALVISHAVWDVAVFVLFPIM